MRYFFMTICIVGSVVAVGAAKENKFWPEKTAFRLEIVDEQLDVSAPTFVVRLSNLGPDTIYAAANVGTTDLAPLFVDGLFDNSWKTVSGPGDVRARCTIVLQAGDTLVFHVNADPRMFSSSVPAKVRVATVVYHSRN